MYFFSIKDISFSERIRNLIATSGNYSVGTQIFNGIANVTFEDCLSLIGCDGQYHHVENSCGTYDLMCMAGDPSLTIQDIVCEQEDPCSTARLVAYGGIALAATAVTACTLLYHYSRNSTKGSESNKDTIEYVDFPIGSNEVQVELTPHSIGSSSIGSSEMQIELTPSMESSEMKSDSTLVVNSVSNVNVSSSVEHTEKSKKPLYWNGSRKGVRNFRFF